MLSAVPYIDGARDGERCSDLVCTVAIMQHALLNDVASVKS
jgi:hypothetical protein